MKFRLAKKIRKDKGLKYYIAKEGFLGFIFSIFVVSVRYTVRSTHYPCPTT
jgi:hypothetical protein